MARARLLKPGFFTNEELSMVSPTARLMFAGLWTIADREGRLEDRPRRIKATLFPYDDIDANELLGELAMHGFIVRYEAEGERFISVLSFTKHQHPHPKEPPSQIPPCPSHLPATGKQVASTLQDRNKPLSSPAEAGSSGSSEAEAEAEADNASPGEAAAAADDDEESGPFADSEYRTVCDEWARATGMLLAPRPAEMMVAWVERSSLQTVLDAIGEAAIANARSPAYVLKILERWEREGRERRELEGDDLAARKKRYAPLVPITDQRGTG